jgi:hypothetical protein
MWIPFIIPFYQAGLERGDVLESNVLPHVTPAERGPIIPAYFAYYLNIHMKHMKGGGAVGGVRGRGSPAETFHLCASPVP